MILFNIVPPFRMFLVVLVLLCDAVGKQNRGSKTTTGRQQQTTDAARQQVGKQNRGSKTTTARQQQTTDAARQQQS